MQTLPYMLPNPQHMNVAIREVTLPRWLDNFIFNHLDATYCRSNSDMIVIDYTPEKIRNYLGTYFPRSFSESYCIFKQYLLSANSFVSGDTISLLDFGCGTGGEIIGIATAISECRKNIKLITVKAIDGNQYALNRFDDIKDEFNRQHNVKIRSNLSAVKIDDFYDLSILDTLLDTFYDIVISFKAICEFISKQQFDKNAYEYLAKFMIQKISTSGLMLLVDVTSKNDVAQDWLPNLMDKGLFAANANLKYRNYSNNETFIVHHSRKHGDVSKVAWRIITK